MVKASSLCSHSFMGKPSLFFFGFFGPLSLEGWNCVVDMLIGYSWCLFSDYWWKLGKRMQELCIDYIEWPEHEKG